MKVEPASLAYVQNVVATVTTIGIDSVILEPGRVRAVDEDSTVFLLHTTGVPDFEFGSIGINRIATFASRLSIAKSIADFTIDATVDGPEDAQYVRALTMKAKGTKIDYRCANPATIRAPKGMNDAIKYRVKMQPEAVLHMTKGKDAMGADEVTLIGNTDGASFELVDINGDKLTYKFADDVDLVQPDDTSDPKFSHKYPLKLMLTLFKHNSDSAFHITTRGMLKTSINGLDVYVLPRT